MKNEGSWQPTKFVQTKSGLRGSRDRRHLAPGSRFAADLVAPQYEQALRCHASGRLLDLGCGHVPLYAAYREFVDEITCVDWENTLHASSHLDTTANLNEPIPLPSSAYDTIIMTDVLEHIMEPELLISELSRMLRPGGKVIIGVPFFYWLHEEPFDFYRYTEHALRRYCERHNLRILSLESSGGLPDIMLDMVAKASQFLPNPLARPFGLLHDLTTRLLCNTKLYKRLARRTAKKFPLGYLVVARLAE